MAKKFIDPEVERVLSNMNSINIHKAKIYDYSIEDFIIEKNKWRHKDWKCWMQGTKNTVLNYIKECNKPWGKRNFNNFHLVKD